MFGHLGAKVGEQGPKMQQMTEKVGFLEAWRGEGPTQFPQKSRVPPLKKLQRKGLELPPPPGAPNSTWKLVELKLWMELPMDRDTQHVPKGTWWINITISLILLLLELFFQHQAFSPKTPKPQNPIK